jgi:hypothetical protein
MGTENHVDSLSMPFQGRFRFQEEQAKVFLKIKMN